MEDFSERGNEPSSCIKDGDFLDQLTEGPLLHEVT